MSTSSVVIHEPLPIQRSNPLSGIDVGALIEKAMSGTEAVAVIERLQVLRRELHAEQAEQAFNDAMAALKAECPPLVKRRKSNVSTYAPIEDVEAVLAPFCAKHGFHHSYETDAGSLDGWVIARCIVTHRLGHTKVTTTKLPVADSPVNGSGKRVTSATQQYDGAITSANRRALRNAYGVVVVGEDDDCAPKTKPRGPSKLEPDKDALRPLCKELWAAVKATGATTGQERDWNAVNQYLWKMEFLDAGAEDAAPNLSAEKFADVIKAVKGAGR